VGKGRQAARCPGQRVLEPASLAEDLGDLQEVVAGAEVAAHDGDQVIDVAGVLGEPLRPASTSMRTARAGRRRVDAILRRVTVVGEGANPRTSCVASVPYPCPRAPAGQMPIEKRPQRCLTRSSSK
jgi:hypothetical protein